MTTTIFLDNDGVLVDTEKYYCEANMVTSRQYGYNLTLGEYRRLFLADGTGMQEVADRIGWAAERLAAYRRERDALFHEYITTREVALEGVAEGLARLAGQFSLCVVTSAPRQFFDAVHRRTGFARFFRAVISGDTVTRHKPAPDPYLAAMAAMATAPGQGIAVEDSERGLRAAAAAGLSCIVVPQELTAHQDFGMAKAVVKTFAEAVAAIEKEAAR